MYTNKEKDLAVEVTFINLYTLSKKNKTIYLNSFDPMNPAHRALHTIASMVSSTQNFRLCIGCSIFKYWKYKKVYGANAFARRKALKDGLTCDDMITHIENAQKHPGIFKEIYEAYYKF